MHTFGDVHAYSNHFNVLKEQMNRKPYPFPEVKLNKKIKEIDDFKLEDIELVNYQAHPGLKAEIATIGGFEDKK